MIEAAPLGRPYQRPYRDARVPPEPDGSLAVELTSETSSRSAETPTPAAFPIV